jgi:hypothetical protein
MRLLQPWFLLLSGLLPLLGWLLGRSRIKAAAAAGKLRGAAAGSPPRAWPGRRGTLTLAALACMVLALARPAWNPRAQPGAPGQRDIIFAVDVSRSMLAADVHPSRLEAARIAIHESLGALRGRRLGLVTFAGSASLRVPLTQDHEFMRYMLERIDTSDASVGGTSIQAALEKILSTLVTKGDEDGRDIVLFTDGEDTVSDISKTAQLLRDSGARLLIVGLGDQVGGARVPAPQGAETKWMQYDGGDVISRLDDTTLATLAAASPGVVYVAAGTRPFSLLGLIGGLPAETKARPMTEGMEPVYTEAYPALVLLALLLWLLPMWPAWSHRGNAVTAVALVCLLVGCGRKTPDPSVREYQRRVKQGEQLAASAEAMAAQDPEAAGGGLHQAREQFLLAALLVPADANCARRITALTARIREIEARLAEQRKADEECREELAQAIERLKILLAKQVELSAKSQALLRQKPPVSPQEQHAAIPPATSGQGEVRAGTASVLETVSAHQGMIRKLLSSAFEKSVAPPGTQFDGAVAQLAEALSAQDQTLASLGAAAPDLPAANSGMRIAAARMKQALDELASGDNQTSDEGESDESMEDFEYDEDMELTDADQAANQSMPAMSGQFKTALDARSLPIPNYSQEEILEEEARNLQDRARKREARAGSGVKKNW